MGICNGSLFLVICDPEGEKRGTIKMISSSKKVYKATRVGVIGLFIFLFVECSRRPEFFFGAFGLSFPEAKHFCTNARSYLVILTGGDSDTSISPLSKVVAIVKVVDKLSSGASFKNKNKSLSNKVLGYVSSY